MYQSYCLQWWNHWKYQYDVHQGDDPKTFSFQKFTTVYSLPDNVVLCDTKEAQNGWLVLEHQPLQLDPLSETEVSPISDFVSFLKLQPKYISQYYIHVDFHINSCTFYDQLGVDLTIVFASDGDTRPPQGSIGFILASTDTGNRIIICWGQPTGIDLQSYCSEICSFLVAVRLLHLLVEFYDTRDNLSKVITNIFKIHTDSQSM